MWKKVVTPVFLVCLFWAVFSGTTTYYIAWSSDSHERILRENVTSIRAAGQMQEALWQMQAAFVDAIADQDFEHQEFSRLQTQFERSLASAGQTAAAPGERSLVSTIEKQYVAYCSFIDRHLFDHGRDKGATSSIGDQSAALARGVAKPCTELLGLNEQLMEETAAQTAHLERTLMFARLAFLVAGPAVGIYIGLRLARSLHQSISRISVTLNDASGELDQDLGRVDILPVCESGDLDRLNEQVQTISMRIRQVVSELHKARQETMVAERLAVVGELAAGVAHEIRNPLTSVKLLIQTAPRAGSGICLHESHAHIILQEIGRMEDTIQGLLDFARSPELHRVEHDLRDTLRRALNLVEGRASHERVSILLRLCESALPVSADPEQLHQVFVNLLINGIESAGPDDLLEVSAGVADPQGRVGRIVVADYGAGIAPERLARIFEPFVTSKARGTGLGLAISRRIVQEHGGKITAANRGGGGAVFTVELPLTDIVAADAVAGRRGPQIDAQGANLATAGRPSSGAANGETIDR